MIDINRILCPIDFSEYSDHALRYAMKMASWYGAQLQVLHVMPLLPPPAVSGLGAAARHLAAKNLNAAVERWREPDVDVATELLESDDTPARIVARADAFDADLIVTGSHGRTGMKRAFLGSVVEPLLHRSHQPVLIIPAGLDQRQLEQPVTFARIICAIDFSAASLAGCAYAFSIAEEANAKLTLLNVVEVPPELVNPPQPPDFNIERVHAEADAERLARLRTLVPEHAREYCTVETAVLEGGASRQLLRLADEQHAELIVLGVHGRNKLDLAVFGSNAKDVVTRAHCPVLIVPASRRTGRAPVHLGGRHDEPAAVRR
jgi:nucleotide-binding universal stress UspA family protein